MKLKAFTFMSVAVLLAGSVQASLVMEIDTANEQFRLTGSDTGTSEYSAEFGYSVVWSTVYTGGPVGPELIYEDNSSDFFSQTFQVAGLQVHRPDSTAMGFTTIYALSGSEFTSITGSGAWNDYSGMDDDLKIYFELIIGNNIPLSRLAGGEGDLGWSPISVQAVPEPATVSLFGITAAVGFLIRRRFLS